MGTARLGVDIGGTFTDAVVRRADERLFTGKSLTTHSALAQGVLSAIDEALAAAGIQLPDVHSIVHGTTLVTNALIERRGARTALLTTRGFRDVLEMARENRYDLYDLQLEKPAPLVPRELRFEVDERLAADGAMLTPLNEEQVREALERMKAAGVEAVAVSFLHSFRNPTHERRAGQIIAECWPEAMVSVSSEVVPVIREYERTSTTVANVYTRAIVESYLRQLERELRERGFAGQLLMLLSSGGTCTLETACRFPIRVLESGPAGGVLAAAALSRAGGSGDLLPFDMGGTTAKASFVEAGQPLQSSEFEVARMYRFKRGSGLPIRTPVLEMIEIGAGGGSIASLDRLGLIKVGPQSAGSDPGPACYGRGGQEPTVTDADLALGYLDADFFLGGSMRLDCQRALDALSERIAEPLGLDPVQAAAGVHRLVNENMASAVKVHAIERGRDPSRFALFAFGGAGPVHAAFVAELVGSRQVICPPGAGVASAFGFLAAPFAFDFVRSYSSGLADADWPAVNALLDEMAADGLALLEAGGLARSDARVVRSCEMRYKGQMHEILVELPSGTLGPAAVPAIEERFAAAYETLFKRSLPGRPLEALTWHVNVAGPDPEVSFDFARPEGTGSNARKGSRSVHFPVCGFADTPVYDRYQLAPGAAFEGPAIVEERESTVVVPPTWHASVDGLGCIVLSRTGRQGGALA
ncbi:MAG TPA: hydantoinase/oxoprolinase family protein [Chloroflexota bacterium]|nr:hydantoinase/oxoprolinase family protein [Chloroflexota bacterium]